MIASDPSQTFVQEFTRANNGKAFYTDSTLGEMIFEDYEKNEKNALDNPWKNQ